MTNNDILRSIRYVLNVHETKLVEILALDGCVVSKAEMISYLKKEEEPGFAECPHLVLAHFLNGLIYFKRGKDEARPALHLETPVTNNIVLKKIRVALELKDVDIIALIKKTGLNVTKTELGALFRRPDHPNYRVCGDQFLRNFFKGLAA